MSVKKKIKSLQLVAIFLIILLLVAFLIIKNQGNKAYTNSAISIIASEDTISADIILDDKKTSNIMTPKDILIGKIDVSNETLVLVPSQYASREGIYMHKEAFEAFLEMYNAAEKDGINLQIISGFRSFYHQKTIWENKWNGRVKLTGNILATDISDKQKRALEILKFSAMPGTSRHHWGTDIDLNSLNNSYFESGEGKKVYEWLLQNANIYGFCRPYSVKGKDRMTGYEEEKWHWSYMPLAKKYLSDYIEIIIYDDIMGFDGCETAENINVIEKYIININPECKK
jgi:zinc D-Ala-D-Ala carboxypeptidase